MSPVIFRVILISIGYLFGMIQTAYLYGKAHGIDIREHGSGNAGTTNTLRVLGKKAGLVVFVGDIGKICIPALIIGFIWPMLVDNGIVDVSGIALAEGQDIYSLKYLWKLYIGLGGVLGHNFPFYLGFKGGKGIAATSGMILGYYWPFVPMGLLVFFGTLVITHYVSLASLLLLLMFLSVNIIFGFCQVGVFALIPSAILIEMYIMAFILLVIGYARHSENIKRLLSGTERKTYVFKKNKENIENENK